MTQAKLITWDCPECGETHEDLEHAETHCRKCGLIVIVVVGAVFSQGEYVDDYPYTLDTIYCLDCEAKAEAPGTGLPPGWGWILTADDGYCYGCPDHKDERETFS